MTARKTLPKDPASEDRRSYEEAHKEVEMMDGAQVSGLVFSPALVPRGAAGSSPRDRELKKMSPDQREDDIVEKDDRYRRPVFKSARDEQDERYRARQEMNKLKSSGGPR